MESHVRELSLAMATERPKAPPLPPGAASRMLILLADTATSHALAGELDDARRVAADAERLLADVAEDAKTDRRIAALACFALGRALLAADDPAGRRLLEDAGATFEELGEEATVLAIDTLLRDAATRIEESPCSFVGAPRARR